MVVQLWPDDIFNCVSCFLVKKHAAFKWKDAISGFPVSPCSAEALVRCGEKIKYILITYFLGNIYAKNCHNRTVYVKIIASFKGGTFFLETQCIYVAARCYTQRSRPHFVYIYTRWQFIMTGQAVTQAWPGLLKVRRAFHMPLWW